MAEFALLLKHYCLKEDDCRKKISDKHLREMDPYCSKWKELPSYLGLEAHFVGDIEGNYAKEEERRYQFLFGWRERKGFEANYKALIEALLKIKRRNDAEGVCELLKAMCPQQSIGSASSQSVTTSITSQQPLETPSSPTTIGMTQ